MNVKQMLLISKHRGKLDKFLERKNYFFNTECKANKTYLKIPWNDLYLILFVSSNLFNAYFTSFWSNFK